MTEETAATTTESTLARLRRIEGQIRGIHRMLDEGRMCEDVLTQLMAARSGLDQVGLLIMDHHIEHCLLSGLPADAGLRHLQQALRLWLRFGAPSPPPQ
ncbi:MAG TPA: metal-sensitive transcriptional regulator [Dehalococcoidia bacterium]|nr:metal-sensitive transcriptional regulator [Dehalococcoidia bacterium]